LTVSRPAFVGGCASRSPHIQGPHQPIGIAPLRLALDDEGVATHGELVAGAWGATVEQIAAATGWQHHTIRGAISGALKKKLGLTVEATRTREVGPNKTGAKGSSTVYRITGPGQAAGSPSAAG
jgi:hypothetical protein